MDFEVFLDQLIPCMELGTATSAALRDSLLFANAFLLNDDDSGDLDDVIYQSVYNKIGAEDYRISSETEKAIFQEMTEEAKDHYYVYLHEFAEEYETYGMLVSAMVCEYVSDLTMVVLDDIYGGDDEDENKEVA